MIRKSLLICGILSSLLYAAMNVFIPMLYEGYSSASQTVSELSAVGAPTRPLWVWLGIVYTLLVAAFGWGVWKSAGGNRPLRIVGALMLVHGVIDLIWPLAPMHQREIIAAGGSTLSDTHAHRYFYGNGSPHDAHDWIWGSGIRKAVPSLFYRHIGDSYCVWYFNGNSISRYFKKPAHAVDRCLGTYQYRRFHALGSSACHPSLTCREEEVTSIDLSN